MTWMYFTLGKDHFLYDENNNRVTFNYISLKFDSVAEAEKFLEENNIRASVREEN